MKATINGIVVEGTPQEIHELMVQMGPVKLSIDAQKEPDLQEGVHYEIITIPKREQDDLPSSKPVKRALSDTVINHLQEWHKEIEEEYAKPSGSTTRLMHNND